MKATGKQKVATLLLGLLGFTAAGCTAQDNSPEAQPQAQSLPEISVQLWSVKDDVKRDFKGTLQALAAMGFDGVEFAGEFGEFTDDPAGLKVFLEQNTLR